MSATITWSAVNEKVLHVGSPSTVIGQLADVFGDLPLELGEEDVVKLQVMAKMWTGKDNPYSALVEAILTHGTIRIKATY